jgi:hypothetical protein
MLDRNDKVAVVANEAAHRTAFFHGCKKGPRSAGPFASP